MLTILFNLALDFSQTRIKMFYEKETLLSINFDEYQTGNLLRNFNIIFMWKTLKCLKDVPWILFHHLFLKCIWILFLQEAHFQGLFFKKVEKYKSHKKYQKSGEFVPN